MRKFLFLIGWVEGSDTAVDNDPINGGGKTGIHNQDDLLPQFKAGNENVLAVVFHILVPQVDAKEIATAFGYKEAFHHNYTAHDSTSILLTEKEWSGIDWDEVGGVKIVEV